MRKGTIYRYELRRLLLSKEYLLLVAATTAYSVSLLRSMVMYGTNYTAPFSSLTFSTYCALLTPFLFTLLLILCARQAKPSELGAAAIISATPMPVPVFRLLRYGAIATAYLIPLCLSVIICFSYYLLVFGYSVFGGLVWSGALLLLPPSVLIFGAAALLGKKKVIFIYALLAMILVVGVFRISLPAWMDIIGSSAARFTDGGGRESGFTLPFLAGRAAFLFAGLLLTAVSLRRNGGENTIR